MMTLVDWRDVASDAVQPLLLAERCRTLDTLHWDLGPSLETVERARQSGDLTGFILHDLMRRPVGWVFYQLADRLLQIGGVHASTAGGLRLLLDGVLESPEAQIAQRVSCFLEARTDSLVSALVRLRFDLQRHCYLESMLALPWPAPSALVEARSLVPADAPALVRLLEGAYAGERGARTFAPNARIDEWARFTGRLLNGCASGAWQTGQSFAVTKQDGELAAAVVTTEIARGVAHVAQVVVDPAYRRRGVARQLLLMAAAAAIAHGAKRLTMMVGEDNDGARTLCASLGFTQRSTFVYGTRGPVTRSRSSGTIGATGGARGYRLGGLLESRV